MKVFSLIIPTIHRKREVERLLTSICDLNFDLNQIEVIIVDQNPQDILKDIIDKYKNKLDLKYFKVNFKGAAKARNYGFKFAKGKFIHFPDDDSFYERNTLKSVKEVFSLKEDIAAVSIRVIDPITKENALLNFPKKDQYVNCRNFFKTTIEFNIFFRKEILEKVGLFDERFGVGSIFPSEEGGDLILRSLKKGLKIYYQPNIIIYHKDKRNPEIKKIYDYAVGFGALLVKHIKGKNLCIIPYGVSYIGKTIIGLFLFRFNKYKRSKYFYRLKGIIDGIKKAKKQL